jgi:ABC-2 type transport system ATP-binding protein
MIADISTIVAREMGVRRWGRWVLRPATFGITGGVIGLTGSPGVGTSALLATFATMRRPSAGALDILGCDTGRSAELRGLRARIGYLPTDVSWASGLRVTDFVAYSGYYKHITMTAVQSVLERLELGDVATMELGMLPNDVRLRAAMAATCVHDPELVLLDEPLAGVTEQAADELIPLLRSLAPTVLVTAPVAGQLVGWCDQVFALARGRLTELATRPCPAVTGGREPYLPVSRPPGIGISRDRIPKPEVHEPGRTARDVPALAAGAGPERLPVGSGAGV